MRIVMCESSRIFLLIAWTLAVLAPAGLAQGFYLDPPLGEPGLAGLESRLRIDHDTIPPAVEDATVSPFGGGWFVPNVPSFDREPPWTTVVEVGGHGGVAWRLTLLDHANVHVRVEWITEQLLLVEVWWGRTLSSELLFDAQSGARVHTTTYAWYGAGRADDAPP